MEKASQAFTTHRAAGPKRTGMDEAWLWWLSWLCLLSAIEIRGGTEGQRRA